jgi:sortase A
MSDILSTPRSTGSRRARRRARRSRPARSGRGRSWRGLSWLLIALGALALLDAGVTLVWQEPFSALYARIEQDRLSGALHTLERTAPTAVERHRLALLPAQRARIAFLARELERRAAAGSAIGRIEIPSIGVDFVLVKGTGSAELTKGPGIYSKSVYPGIHFPGVGGTTAIAGHRTTYLEPFRHIDALHRGERILLDMPYARLTYTITGHRVVAETDVAAAVSPVGYSRLVLSACTPLFSAEKRLLVYARLVRSVPVGAARVDGVPARGVPARGVPARGVPARGASARGALPTLGSARSSASISLAGSGRDSA